MNFWLVLTVNSITFGGLLFLLSAGFSLIFGLMRIPNLTHGSLFMLGAYIGATFVIGILGVKMNFWLAAVLATLSVALLGALAERMLLRRLPGDQLAQVLVTLGLSFMAADFCLMVWGGDPLSVTTPPELAGFARFGALVFPNYRLAIIVIAFVVAVGLWLLLDRQCPAADLVEGNHAIALRILDMVCEDRGAAFARGGHAAELRQAFAEIDVVAQDHRHAFLADEITADDEGFRKPVGLRLLGIGQIKPEVRSVAKQLAENRQIPRR